MSGRSETFNTALLWLGCGLFWLLLVLQFGHALGHALLPLVGWELNWLAPQYRLTALHLGATGLDMSVQAGFTTREAMIIGGHYLPAGTALQSSTLAGHWWQPLVIILSLLSAAAIKRRHNAFILLLLSLPCAGLLLMMDVPIVLLGALQDLLAPHAFSLKVMWMNFLNGGGRLALAIAVALWAVALCPSRDTCHWHLPAVGTTR